MNNTSRSRRLTFAAVSTGAIVALVLAGCGNSRGGDTDSDSAPSSCDLAPYQDADIDWEQFSGETIAVAAQSHPWWDTVEPQLDCFTDLTGIVVDPNVLGEDQYIANVAVELSSGSSTPDVFMINQFGQATGSGWLEPLDDYLSNADVTDEDWYDPEDFFPGATSYSQEDGVYVALPITSEVQMLFVRSDLVQGPLTTMDELAEATAAADTDEVSGFSARAVASPSQSPWSYAGFSFSEGAQLLDENGQPQFDSAANVAALTAYADLIRDHGPTGASGWGFLENQQAMQQGRLAIWADSSSLLGSLMDPTTSTVADSVEAFPFPAGDGGSVPNLYYWTIGMNSRSEHKDAAWLFMQWATSSPISTAAGANGASPARASAWDAPESTSTIGTENAERVRAALEDADSTEFSNTWKETNWSQMADPLARAINAAVSGNDPATELRNAQQAAEGMAQ